MTQTRRDACDSVLWRAVTLRNRSPRLTSVKNVDEVRVKVEFKSLANVARRGVTVAGIGWLLAGCAVAQYASSGISSIGKTLSGGGGVSEEKLLESAKSDGDGFETKIKVGRNCPKFIAWPRDKRITIFEQGRVGDGFAVIHRGEITRTARECQESAGQVAVKYGFAGRVLLGPKGQPGAIRLPAKIHITDKDRQTIRTEDVIVSAVITTDKPYGFFSYVGNTVVKVPPGFSPGDFKIFVAFDRQVPGSG